MRSKNLDQNYNFIPWEISMNEYNTFIDDIEHKVYDLLERYKDPLIQVLRYRDESWFVPQEIEIPTKYIIKNFHSIPDNTIHHHESMEFSIERENWNTFYIYSTEQEEPYILNIEKNIPSTTPHWSYRKITYNEKIYEELLLTWNTYNHIRSQAEKIKERSDIDHASWLLSQQEAKNLCIRNIFHDIPEYKKWDVICTSKTDKHRADEEIITQELLDAQTRNSDIKTYIQKLSRLHTPSWLFKLYERMFYIFDIQTMIEQAHTYNRSLYLAAATLWFQLPMYIKNYTLPNGNLVYWLDIPSCAKHLYDHIDFIDNAFAHIDEIGILDSRNNNYEEGRKIWNETIKPYIWKKF